MTRTASLRAQYRTAEQIIADIVASIDQYAAHPDCYALSLKLARLSAILRTNFAVEEQALYPPMLASDDREAAILARLFQSELGRLRVRFDRFVDRWSSSSSLSEAPNQFEFEAGMMFAAIRDRIHRVNRDLYPIADAVAALAGQRVPPVRAQPLLPSAVSAS